MTDTPDPKNLRTIIKPTGKLRYIQRTKDFQPYRVLQQEFSLREYDGFIWTQTERIYWQDVPTETEDGR